MAVPKYKRSKQRTRTQRTAWMQKQQLRLVRSINIVTCPQCSARIPERTVCRECGYYKGIQMVEKKSAPVRVISAD